MVYGPFADSELTEDYPFTTKSRAPFYQSHQRDQQPSTNSYDMQTDEGKVLPTSYEELRKRHRERRFDGPKRLPSQPQPEVYSNSDLNLLLQYIMGQCSVGKDQANRIQFLSDSGRFLQGTTHKTAKRAKFSSLVPYLTRNLNARKWKVCIKFNVKIDL